jgi:GxxExxY protein
VYLTQRRKDAEIDICMNIHRSLGPGLLESVYEKVLCHELALAKIEFRSQQPINLFYKNLVIPHAYRADIIVEGKLVVELKSCESITPVHQKVLLTYLRLSNIKLGLLVNFGSALLKDGIRRVVNNL